MTPSIIAPPPTRTERLVSHQPNMRDGDLLLWRRDRKSLFSRLIAGTGRTIYSHAAIFAWWDDCPMVLELREWSGGRIITLAEAVRSAPGRIDHYSAHPDTSGVLAERGMREMVKSRMRQKAGKQYGWLAVILVGILRLRIAQFVMARFPDRMRVDLADDNWPWLPEHCSDGASDAWEFVGQDPVPGLGGTFTEPGDLARSRLFKFEKTLVN